MPTTGSFSPLDGIARSMSPPACVVASDSANNDPRPSVSAAPAPSPSLTASRREMKRSADIRAPLSEGWSGMTYLHDMPKRSQPGEWWKSYFDAQYLLEYEPLFTFERDRQEVASLMDLLGLPSGARILDVPCGQGRHAHLLAEAGFDVDGFDYSEDLLARARERGTGSRLRYTRGDMRKLPTRWTR